MPDDSIGHKKGEKPWLAKEKIARNARFVVASTGNINLVEPAVAGLLSADPAKIAVLKGYNSNEQNLREIRSLYKRGGHLLKNR